MASRFRGPSRGRINSNVFLPSGDGGVALSHLFKSVGSVEARLRKRGVNGNCALSGRQRLADVLTLSVAGAARTRYAAEESLRILADAAG